MVYRATVERDGQQRDQELEDALAALAARPRDLEGERVLAKLRRELAAVDAPAPRIGRFELRSEIGAGAMGVVYRAYDPELQREVAIKVLHDVHADHELALREARALARLSHPNTVTIYEVGQDRGAIFVAMELVRGQTLRQWLAAPRSPKAIIDDMLDAGRGLAAAHDGGLIHGDFKPDNVLVGEDRVRVADFGLARLGEDNSHQRAGTPAYMAPEQLDGQAASAASDQFAFGVTLFEALVGERPYAGDSIASLREAMQEGPLALESSTRLARLPRWLNKLLHRALAQAPDERYHAMDALLADLDRRPLARQLRWSLALIFAAMVGVALFAYQRGRVHDLCSGGQAHASRTWNRERAARVRHAFLQTKVARAARTFEQTAQSIRAYLAAWQRSYRAICEATRARGEQSEALLDARMACLQRHLGRLHALTRLSLGVRDGAETLAAQAAVRALPAPGRCERGDARHIASPAPRDPKLHQQATRLSEEVNNGWALYALGRYGEASHVSRRLEAKLLRLRWPLTRAEGLLFVGAVRGRVGGPGQASPLLQSALEAAAEAGADRLVLRIWKRLLKDALFAGEHRRVLEWARFAKAAAARASEPAAEIIAIVGEAELLAGHTQAARDTLTRALDALQATGAAGRVVAIALSNLGNAQLQLGDLRAAEQSYRRALELVKRDLGADHPTLSRFFDKLGRVARQKGELKRALKLHRRALAIREASFGKEDRTVASTLLELGRTEIAAGDAAAAGSHLSRALSIRQRAYGADHLRLAAIHEARGETAWISGKPSLARADWQRARAIRRERSPRHGAIRRLDCLLALSPSQAIGRCASAGTPTPTPQPAP